MARASIASARPPRGSRRVPAIFQATFITDGFLARNDVLAFDSKSNSWHLYEVKGTSAVHERGGERNHLDDLAFQLSVLKRSGVSVSKCGVVHLNSEYARAGDLDIEQLFKVEDVTDKVAERLPVVEEKMATALDYLSKKTEPPQGCECIYRGRSNQCTTFQYSNPHAPAYSVHDLSRIGASKKKLLWLVENKIFHLDDIPVDGIELSDIQLKQVLAHKRGKPIIDHEGVRQELESLQFPLYFLDYETFSPAIPLFSGYGPFEKVPFQFSLHILHRPGEEPEHVEYLHMDQSDPTEAVINLLREHILPKGTIIAWNKSFEMDVHRRMAGADAGTWADDRAHELDVLRPHGLFKKQYYVHPAFKGSVSVKYVLPALVPELSYKELSIRGGAQASEAWWAMVSSLDASEKEMIASDLKKYCGLDTYAMYAIWKHLHEMVHPQGGEAFVPHLKAA
jgi:hypothetical protein